MRLAGILLQQAEVAEQADAHDSKSCTFGYVGSIPTFGKKEPLTLRGFLFPDLHITSSFTVQPL